MKRNLAVATGLAAALVLSACGSGGSSEEGGGEVTMWYSPIAEDIEREYWDGMIKDFMAEHPDVDVSVEIVPWEARTERMQTAFVGNTEPDVTYVLPADVYTYGSQGAFADVSDVIAEDTDDFLPNALDALTYDGTPYGVPTLMGMSSTIYVKQVWDAIGVKPDDYPTTFDEVREFAPRLKEAGYYVTQYDAAPTMTLNGSFYPLLWSSGGRVLNEDATEATINSPAGLEALEFVKWLVDNEYTPKAALTADLPVETSPIAQGKVAMLFSRSVASLTLYGLTDDQLYVGAPTANTESTSYGNVGGYALSADSADNEAAKEWIQFITSPENLEEFLPPRNQLSPRMSVTGLYEDGSNNARLQQWLDRGIVEPAHQAATEIMDVIKPHIQAALLGKTEPQAALDAAAKEIDGALARAGG